LVGARTIKGKMVVDLMPEGAPNKATALLAQRKQARCRAAVYVGDDRTDEDAFALAAREPVLGIRVGKRARSRAPYYLPRQDDVDRLLATLIALRPG
jgi:trehalose 6-phosphate phosphatase